ncbi:hypothetical protein CHU98_g2427 [Xylaria longipes]|nr:hypothetical protein CHU98_g2427 [Xylaria longipes]
MHYADDPKDFRSGIRALESSSRAHMVINVDHGHPFSTTEGSISPIPSQPASGWDGSFRVSIAVMPFRSKGSDVGLSIALLCDNVDD